MKKPTPTKKNGTTTTTTKPKPNKNSSNTKQPPLKVVYISNPMRIVATAAEFRARVQELTGQDAIDHDWSEPQQTNKLTSGVHVGPQDHIINNDNVHVNVPVAVAGFVGEINLDNDNNLGYFVGSSDLGCFEPFDGDEMVIMDQEFETFYGLLKQ